MNNVEHIIYGHDTTKNIVYIEGWGNRIIIFYQTPDGNVYEETIDDYEPWYLNHTERPNMAGNNHFNTMQHLDCMKDINGLYDDRISRDDFLMISDKAANYMIDTGKTLFKGLDFDDVHTVAFDIETTGLDPETDIVKMISIVSNRGYSEVLFDEDESRLINKFIKVINQLDPSILLTYNGFGAEDEFGNMNGFDTWFLMRRCKEHNIRLTIGRNSSEPVVYKIMIRIDADNKYIPMYRVYGRHCIDLRYATVKHDSLDRRLNNYKLKNVIAQYNLESEGRIVLSFDEILEGITSDDPEKRRRTTEYCRDDSQDLIKLHRHICQSYFYLSQIVPFNYYKLMFTGSTAIYNTLMLRQYVYNMHSVPMYSTDPFIFEGAAVDSEPGISYYVGDSDLTSMYPSIQIFYELFPDTDDLHIMKILLNNLRNMRIEFKGDMSREAELHGPKTSNYAMLKGKQLAFKILINSAFGIMSSIGYYWRDNEKAAKITEHGRDIILRLKDKIEELGFHITALDTDGVSYTNGKYFDIDEMTEILKRDCLPKGMYHEEEEGIESKLYKANIVFKKKNYALLHDDGEMTYKGSALTSSKIPPVIKGFIRKAVDLIFEKRIDELSAYYKQLRVDITNQVIPISEFAMTTRIRKTVKTYIRENEHYMQMNGRKKGSQPIYELALETNTDLIVGDKVQTYWSKQYVKKTPNKRLQKKRDEQSHMNMLFQLEDSTPLVPIRKQAWIDDYDKNNPNIHSEEYISNLERKVIGLFLRKKNNKGEWEGIYPEEEYQRIFGTLKYDRSEFVYRDFYAKGEKEWRRITPEEEKQYMINSSEDIYTSVQRFMYDHRVQREHTFHPLYFDIDNQDLDVAFEDTMIIYNYFVNILQVPHNMVLIWFSGSKGFHIEVQHYPFGYKPSPNLTGYNKLIALNLITKYQLTSVDYKSIYSMPRQWRMPFSVNTKTGRRKLPIYEFYKYECFSDLNEFLLELDKTDINTLIQDYEDYIDEVKFKGTLNLTLQEWFNDLIIKYNMKVTRDVIHKSKERYAKLKGGYPKCIEFLLEYSISSSGDRNTATMTLLSFLKESGIGLKEAVDIVVDWTHRIPDGLTSIRGDHKIRTNVGSIAKSVYHYDKYVFACPYIKSLLITRGFECATNCPLKEI